METDRLTDLVVVLLFNAERVGRRFATRAAMVLDVRRARDCSMRSTSIRGARAKALKLARKSKLRRASVAYAIGCGSLDEAADLVRWCETQPSVRHGRDDRTPTAWLDPWRHIDSDLLPWRGMITLPPTPASGCSTGVALNLDSPNHPVNNRLKHLLIHTTFA